MNTSDILRRDPDTIELRGHRISCFDATGEQSDDLIQIGKTAESGPENSITINEGFTVHDGGSEKDTTIDLHTGSSMSLPHDELLVKWPASGAGTGGYDDTSSTHFRSRPRGNTLTGQPIPALSACFHPVGESAPTVVISDTPAWLPWFSGRINAFEGLDDEEYLLYKIGGLMLYSAGIPFAKLSPGADSTSQSGGVPAYFRLGHPAVSPEWDPDATGNVMVEELPGSGGDPTFGGGDTPIIETTRIPTMPDAEIRLFNEGVETAVLTTLEGADGLGGRAALYGGDPDENQPGGVEAVSSDGETVVRIESTHSEYENRMAVGERATVDDETATGVSIAADSTVRAGYVSDGGRGTLSYDDGTMKLRFATEDEVTDRITIEDGFSGEVSDDIGGALHLADSSGEPTIELNTSGSEPPAIMVRNTDGQTAASIDGSGSITLGSAGVGGECTVIGTGGETTLSIEKHGNVTVAGDFVRESESN